MEGFNEMMARCGYEWTGHPVTADGQIYTLHGKLWKHACVAGGKSMLLMPHRMKFVFVD